MSLLHIIAEMARIGGSGGGGTGVSFDPDALAFCDVAGISKLTQRTAVNTLVIALKAAGLWKRMVAIYPMVGGTAEAHKWNLKDPQDTNNAKRLSFNGGWTHSLTGALPNGTNAWADTFIDLAEEVPQYSFHGAYYSRTNTPPGTGDYKLFGYKAQSVPIVFELFFNSRLFAMVGSASIGSQAPVQLTAFNQVNFNKLLGVSCWGYNNFDIYRDTVSLASNPITRFGYFDSINPQNVQTMVIGAYNENGVIKDFSSWECAFCSFGYGLNAAMWASLTAIVNNFQNALSRNV